MQAVGEAWRGTFDRIESEPRTPKGLVGWWWTCWLSSNILDSIANRLVGTGFMQMEAVTPSPEMLNIALGLWALSTLLAVTAAILMLRVYSSSVAAQSRMVSLDALS